MAMPKSEDELRAFDALYRENRQLAFHIAHKILHDEQLAEDAVSDAFFSIAKKFSRLQMLNSHKMQYYIVVTVRNMSFNILKREQPYRDAVEYDDALSHTAAPEPETHDALHSAVARLSATDREILYLRVNLELRFPEIADALGITSAAARQRFRYAKANLKKLLEEDADNA